MRTEHPAAENLASCDRDSPVYRVTFWRRLDEPADVAEERRGYEAEEWDIADADVTSVLGWADRNSAGGTYTVHVATPPEDGKSDLLRLFGVDPTRGAVSAPLYRQLAELTGDITDPVWPT